MPKIQPLSQEIITKIAAGEVIERPVYAVKELVENSIDAHADVVTVHIEESGLKTINVIDNGEGMDETDLKASFQPHSTSKLTTVEDLSAIQTLGFRGEALASIAAISKMKISSRTANVPTGTSVIIKEGKLERISPIGMPIGTNILVENLFFTLPGRKKFLKSQRTEFRKILEVMMQFALVYPHVQFILTHNGKTILDLPKANAMDQRLQKIFGNDVSAHFIPVSLTDGYIGIKGFIARPQITTKTPHNQFLYVNSRKIADRLIASTIRNAYGTLLEKHVHPVFILFLEVPHEIVDVNVHPRKEEVRFHSQQQVIDAVFQGITRTLRDNSLAYTSELLQKNVLPTTHSYAGQLLRDKKMDWSLERSSKIDLTHTLPVHNLFILAPTNDGIVLIDQHAAHERILFEQFSSSFLEEKRKNESFTLSKPFIFELGLSESELLLEYIEQFELLGFSIEHFKQNIFYLNAVPDLLRDRDYRELIVEMLHEIEEGGAATIDTISQKMLAYLACRSAVKAGDKLTQKQSKELVEKLEKTNNNATCPHGRPTRIVMDLPTLYKMFKRG